MLNITLSLTWTKITALFIYDYLLNLGSEIDLMWRGGFQLVKAVYFICRYLPVFGLIYGLTAMSADSTQTQVMISSISMSWELIFPSISFNLQHLRFTEPCDSCDHLLHFIGALGILVLSGVTCPSLICYMLPHLSLTIATQVVSGLQAYAMYNQSRGILGILIFLGIAIIVLDSMSMS